MFVDKNGSVLVKVLIFGIPLVIFGYLLFLHVFVTQEFVYSYDIGSKEDMSNNYLQPVERTSETYSLGKENYRDINDFLIYSAVPYIRGSSSLSVELKIKTNSEQKILFGIKNNTGWSYEWEEMEILESKGDILLLVKEVSLDGAYPEDGMLSLAFYVDDQLEESSNITYAVDTIEIKVVKPGFLL